MTNISLKNDKFYVRVYIGGEKMDKYQTIGPFLEEKAHKMMIKYLSTGICSWMEKVE